jgi:uncharacterized RDD family membrane protein YckC
MTDVFDEPEHAAPADDLAPLDLRWLAAGVDVGLSVAAVLVGIAVGIGLVVALGLTGVTAAWLALAVAAGSVLTPYAVSWWLIVRDGQSIGKRWVDIRIVRTDGRLPGFFAGVVLRSWTMLLASRLCSVADLLDGAMVLRRDRRALHDHLAGTRVVRGSVPFRR